MKTRPVFGRCRLVLIVLTSYVYKTGYVIHTKIMFKEKSIENTNEEEEEKKKEITLTLFISLSCVFFSFIHVL